MGHILGLEQVDRQSATLVFWLEAEVSKASWTELSIWISLSISPLCSPRLLYMSKKFCVSVCLVAT